MCNCDQRLEAIGIYLKMGKALLDAFDEENLMSSNEDVLMGLLCLSILTTMTETMIPKETGISPGICGLGRTFTGFLN